MIPSCRQPMALQSLHSSSPTWTVGRHGKWREIFTVAFTVQIDVTEKQQKSTLHLLAEFPAFPNPGFNPLHIQKAWPIRHNVLPESWPLIWPPHQTLLGLLFYWYLPSVKLSFPRDRHTRPSANPPTVTLNPLQTEVQGSGFGMHQSSP